MSARARKNEIPDLSGNTNRRLGENGAVGSMRFQHWDKHPELKTILICTMNLDVSEVANRCFVNI